MNQEGIPVTHDIDKAKIKARTWPVKHQRAKETYQGTRKPKSKIEKKWPKCVRSLYARLRTGHVKELKTYRHRLGLEEDGICAECKLEDETIEHVLAAALLTPQADASYGKKKVRTLLSTAS